MVRGTGTESPPFIKKCEAELGACGEGDEIRCILVVTHGTAVDTKTRKSNYKCLTRWYMTPVRVSKFTPERSPNCWRGCASPGTMAHLWWECPKIKIFWQEVTRLIEEITRKAIPFDPWDCLFHRSEGGKRGYKTSIVPVLLNSAKNIIPKKWQELEAPRIRDWVARVNEIYTVEREESGEYLERDQTVQRGKWDCWITFKKN